jgi:hypothetical protein
MDLPESWSSKFHDESSAKRSTVDEAVAPGSSSRKGPKRRMPGAGRAGCKTAEIGDMSENLGKKNNQTTCHEDNLFIFVSL